MPELRTFARPTADTAQPERRGTEVDPYDFLYGRFADKVRRVIEGTVVGILFSEADAPSEPYQHVEPGDSDLLYGARGVRAAPRVGHGVIIAGTAAQLPIRELCITAPVGGGYLIDPSTSHYSVRPSNWHFDFPSPWTDEGFQSPTNPETPSALLGAIDFLTASCVRVTGIRSREPECDYITGRAVEASATAMPGTVDSEEVDEELFDHLLNAMTREPEVDENEAESVPDDDYEVILDPASPRITSNAWRGGGSMARGRR